MTPNHSPSFSILMHMWLCTFPFLALILHTWLPVPFSNILHTLWWPGSPMRILPHPQCSLVVAFSLLHLCMGLEMECSFGSSLPLLRSLSLSVSMRVTPALSNSYLPFLVSKIYQTLLSLTLLIIHSDCNSYKDACEPKTPWPPISCPWAYLRHTHPQSYPVSYQYQ